MTGPDSKQERMSRALALMERLAKAIVMHPKLLVMEVDMGTAIVRVSFVTHPDDARIVIGTEGKQLSQFKWLLMAMLEGTGMEGVIDEVRTVEGARAGRLPLVAGTEWPRKQVEELLAETARACYPDVRSRVATRDNGHKTRMDVLFEREPQDRKGFAKAAGLTFLCVGRALGARLAVDAKVLSVGDAARMAQQVKEVVT